jgi:hypothetical protein
VAGTCECGEEPSGSIKRREFLHLSASQAALCSVESVNTFQSIGLLSELFNPPTYLNVCAFSVFYSVTIPPDTFPPGEPSLSPYESSITWECFAIEYEYAMQHKYPYRKTNQPKV